MKQLDRVVTACVFTLLAGCWPLSVPLEPDIVLDSAPRVILDTVTEPDAPGRVDDIAADSSPQEFDSMHADDLDGSDDSAAADTKGVDASIEKDAAPPEDVAPSEDVAPQCGECTESPASAVVALDSTVWESDAGKTALNPLKGFLTSYLWGAPANDFPTSMEFFYIPMSSVWNAEGSTFESGVEPHLEAAAARNHHAVLRIYIDYPKLPSGLPSYLADAVPCKPYEEHGGGCSPDYDDPLLLDAMTGLITALGATYDGDKRLGVLQVGLLGFWGEWHTYPHTEWFASGNTQVEILNAVDSAFTTTQIQVRRPAANSVQLRLGFHDDSFAHSTLGEPDWYFAPSLLKAGAHLRWKEVMIGGELRPELQGTIFTEDYVVGPQAQDLAQCIAETHASYLLNYQAFNGDGTGYVGTVRKKAEAMATQMGYQFELTGATATLGGYKDGTVEAVITLSISQTGVAPFYYSIFPKLEVEGVDPPWVNEEDLKTLLPGESRDVVFDLGRVSVSTVLGAMEVSLESPILLEGQEIRFATQTPWSDDTGRLRLEWSVSCDHADTTVSLGDSVGLAPNGCDCVCDVDGVIRACGEAVCD